MILDLTCSFTLAIPRSQQYMFTVQYHLARTRPSSSKPRILRAIPWIARRVVAAGRGNFALCGASWDHGASDSGSDFIHYLYRICVHDCVTLRSLSSICEASCQAPGARWAFVDVHSAIQRTYQFPMPENFAPPRARERLTGTEISHFYRSAFLAPVVGEVNAARTHLRLP